MVHPRRIFGVIGVFFLIIAILLFYRWLNKPIEVQATQTENGYVVQTKAGKWIDTGVWIGPYRRVYATSSDIFTLAVDDTQIEAVLGDKVFHASTITYPCVNTDGAWITNQGKIYVYADKSFQVGFEKGAWTLAGPL